MADGHGGEEFASLRLDDDLLFGLQFVFSRVRGIYLDVDIWGV